MGEGQNDFRSVVNFENRYVQFAEQALAFHFVWGLGESIAAGGIRGAGRAAGSEIAGGSTKAKWFEPAINETRVSRWMGKAEWEHMQKTGTLVNYRGDKPWIDCTELGAAKPGGTSPIRADFNVPSNSLLPGGNNPDGGKWYHIVQWPNKPPVNSIIRME